LTERDDEPRPGGPRVLVCGWAGAGNIGDELLTDWIVERIESGGGRVLLTTRSHSDTRDRHPSVTPVGWRIRDFAGVLRGVDAICVGPGGIIQDSSSVWNLPAHLTRALIGRARRLPVGGVGLGAEPLARRSSRWLVRQALTGAVGVVARDQGSADALARAGVAADVGADLVFGLAALPAPHRPTGRDGMVVAVGPTVSPGVITPVSRRHDHGDLEQVVEAIEALSARLGGPVVVGAFRGERDIGFGRRLVERLGDTARLIPPDSAELRQAIAGARLVVSSRYHAAVLALVEGTPVVVRSDESKLKSLVTRHGDGSRIEAIGDWSELAAVEIPQPPDNGVRDPSVSRHAEVLADLIEAAVRRRR
jgi:polysaccharide pyruvyl transferase CsaB